MEPLRVLLFKEGLARFCTEEYQKPTEANMADTFMHCTHSPSPDDKKRNTLSILFIEANMADTFMHYTHSPAPVKKKRNTLSILLIESEANIADTFMHCKLSPFQ